MISFLIIAASIVFFIIIVGLLFLVNNIKLIYWTAFFSAFLPFGYISRYFQILPSAVKWLPLFILIVCFIAMLFRQILRNKLAPIPKRIILFYIFIFIFGIISLLYNKVAVLPVLFSGIGLITYLIYNFILNNKEYKLTQEQLLKAIIQIGVFETAVAVFQRIVFVWLLHIGSSDMVAGTFSVDGQFTFYQLFCIILVLVFWFYDRRVFESISNFWLLIIFLASIAVSGNSASLVFLPVIFLSVFAFVNKRKFLLKFRTVLAIIVLLTLTVIIYASFWNSDYDKQQGSSNDILSLLTDPNYLQDHFFGVEYDPQSTLSKNGSLKRGSALTYSYGLISKSSGTLFLGKGPGTTSESQIPGAEGIISKQHEGLKVNRTSYSQVIAELGIGGLFFLGVFIILLFSWNRTGNEMDEFKLIRRATIILLILYFAYENLFDDLILGLVLCSVTSIFLQSNNNSISRSENKNKTLTLASSPVVKNL